MKMKIKKLFVGKHGIRTVWLIAAAVGLYVLSAGGVYYLYRILYSAMMGVWGVTSENILRAPASVQFLYQWSNVIVQLLQGGALIASAMLLRRMTGAECEKKTDMRGMLFGAGMGAACVCVLWCVLMLLGCVRLGWRITKPAFSINTFALLLTISAAALGEGIFLYGALYGGMKKRLPVWAAIAVTTVLRVLMQGVFSPMAIINNALIAVLCCLLTDRRGIGSAIAFRFAWSYLEQAVFGFAGYTAALYETYPVNMYWLSGGNSGIAAGVLTALVLIGACLLLTKPLKKAPSKS